MAGVVTMLFVGLFVLFLVPSAGSNDCSANQEVSCESLRTFKGFTYTVPSNISCFGSCNEQGWYFQNGTFIVDSSQDAGGNRLSIVQDVTPKNLTVTVCENLQWQLDCATCKCNINYTGKHVSDTKHSPAHDSHGKEDGNPNYNAGLPQWGIALIGIASVGAFITILFCCFIRSNSFSCSTRNDVV